MKRRREGGVFMDEQEEEAIIQQMDSTNKTWNAIFRAFFGLFSMFIGIFKIYSGYMTSINDGVVHFPRLRTEYFTRSEYVNGFALVLNGLSVMFGMFPQVQYASLVVCLLQGLYWWPSRYMPWVHLTYLALGGGAVCLLSIYVDRTIRTTNDQVNNLKNFQTRVKGA